MRVDNPVRIKNKYFDFSKEAIYADNTGDKIVN